ncbi:Heavy metal-associated domain containing protein [Trema orientale]|uniref:Heavy metal-associated domain containing protein n=1 Tax=Trema orientale TaxID=63057 RepID=A0A2P5FWU9_TREOI|nr:Heavy metal-associated domain containing protein [Trema orientale]
MSKEEFLKIQKCVLKVNIHCDGCKAKVKKILQKIDGVFTIDIDADQGKVTVSGTADPAIIIKKLAKSGKHAELWGAPKSNQNNNQNQNHLANQLKNMQIDNGKGGNNNNKSQKGGGNNNNSQPKGGGQNGNNQQQQQQQLHQQLQQQHIQQQLQQLQNMKGFQDLKLPQLKGMQMGPNKDQPNPNQKAVKFNVPLEEDYMSDDDYDYEDDDDYDDDEFDDDMDDIQPPLPKNMKQQPGMGNNIGQVPNMMMLNGMMNGNPHAQLMNQSAQKGGNGKKGGGGAGAVPVQVNAPGGGGKKGGGGGTGQNPGGAKNGGKNGGSLPSDGKNGNNGGGGGNSKNVNVNGNGNGNGGANGKKGGGLDGVQVQAMNNKGFQQHHMGPGSGPAPQQGMPGGPNMGQHMAMGQMGQMGNGPMGHIPAVQGLPATSMNGAGGGYFQGAGPEAMPGNPYHQQQQQQQQQYLAAVINQQRAMAGNERFQPMMYARPPPAVNYMPPPYPYPYPQPQPEPHYAHFFSDENTASCNVM